MRLNNLFKKIIGAILAKLGYRVSKMNHDESVVEQVVEEKVATRTPRRSVQEKEFDFISQLPGFLNIDVYGLFQKLGRFYPRKNPAILEIGIFCGKSFLALGLAFKNPSIIVGVDPFYDDFKNSPALEDEGEYLEEASRHLSREERL